jgi:hypothetical protein
MFAMKQLELRWRSRQSKLLSPLRSWVRFLLRTHVKRVSQRSDESRGFSPGTPVFLPQGKLTGHVRINIGRKKNTCGSGSRPILFFSADPIIFSTRLTVRPYFLRVVAGCCQNGVCCDCCHTILLKKT